MLGVLEGYWLELVVCVGDRSRLVLLLLLKGDRLHFWYYYVLHALAFKALDFQVKTNVVDRNVYNAEVWQ
jgi:hypothetical protein